MALIVNTNIQALNAQRNLGINNNKLARSIERLSSGLRINSAADDAAGLSIATKFATQVRGIGQAIRNGNNAISLVQVAEGAISTTTNILQRLRELAVQAASDDNTSADRAILGKEVTNLTDELTRIGTTTEFNTQKLLDGSFTNKIFQVGANAGQEITLNIGNLSADGIGGRAEFNAFLADGVTTAKDEGFIAGEFKINNVAVAATTESDDQFSVLEIQSGSVGTGTSAVSGLTMVINGTTVDIALTGGDAKASGLAAATLTADIVSAINGANLTNVTARAVGSIGFTLVATAGKNLFLAIDSDGTVNSIGNINTVMGLTGVAAMIGSGVQAADQVKNFNGESSAIAKAVAINRTPNTSVTATVQKTTVTADIAITAATLSSGDIFLNGVDIGGVTIGALDSTGALTTAINNKSTETGITASKNSAGNLVLTAKDGRNITLTFSTGDSATAVGFNSGLENNSIVLRGGMRLNSVNSFDLKTGTVNSLIDLDKDSSDSKTISKDLTTFSVSKLKVNTQANATAALLTLDAALDDINNLRADLGAIQNRIEFSISNLEVARENASASESRIRDVDFAAEVAIFTKNQILVQAGAAMLAQANTLPQIALQLLQ
ncbi:MAG: flagellin N-terminal helical domain-containing protein [Candidatus Anammoxibacter sp.]